MFGSRRAARRPATAWRRFAALCALAGMMLTGGLPAACSRAPAEKAPHPDLTQGGAAPPAAQARTAPPGASATPPTAAELRVATSAVVDLDPGRFRSETDAPFVLALFEGLLVPAAGDGPPLPGAAERYDVSPDGLTYTFHLRPNLRWSDGQALTAADFVYSLTRVATGGAGAETAASLRPIQGVPQVAGASPADAPPFGVTAPDARTVRIVLAAPAPHFPDWVATPPYAPVPRHVVEAQGARWTRPEFIVSNGPFRLAAFDPQTGLRLVPNDTYWDRAAVQLSGVTVRFLTDPNMGHRWYERGEVDWLVRAIPRERVIEALAAGSPQLRVDPTACVYQLYFRLDRTPFDDVNVRRAFALAVDRERLVAHVLGMGQQAAAHFTVPGFASRGYAAPAGLRFDPPAAAAALAQAGFGAGAGFPGVTLRVASQAGNREIAEFLIDQWQKHLHVAVTVDLQEWATVNAAARRGDFQLTAFLWCAEYLAPESLLDPFVSTSENNHAGYRSPAFDDAFTRATHEAEPAARLRGLAEAEARLLADLPAAPLFYGVRAHLVHPTVRGWQTNLRALHPLKTLQRLP